MNTVRKAFISVTQSLSFLTIALLMATMAAQAETTTLICRLNTFPGGPTEDQPTTVELNGAQNTVVVHFSAMHHTDPDFSSQPSTTGPLQANFSADSVSFSTPAGATFSINRLTGAMVNSNNLSWTCAPGKPLF
jgi:hypothetical protein